MGEGQRIGREEREGREGGRKGREEREGGEGGRRGKQTEFHTTTMYKTVCHVTSGWYAVFACDPPGSKAAAWN